jgi:PPIC-type PPIASE domain
MRFTKFRLCLLLCGFISLQAQTMPPQHFALVESNLSASHILISWKDQNPLVQRNKGQARALALDIIAQLQADSTKFADLALQYSDDAGSRTKKGYLGSFPKGRMVKAFEEELLLLSEGAFSTTPLQTEFGFHVLKRETLSEPLWGAYLYFQPTSETQTLNIDSLLNAANLSIIKAREPEIEALVPLLSGLGYNEIGHIESPTGRLYAKRAELNPVSGSHILIGWKSDVMPVKRSKAEAEALAKQLLAQVLSNPALFEEFASTQSDSPSKRRRGSMGLWFEGSKITRYPASSVAIAQLNAGQIGTTLVEGASWFEIIRRDR